MRKFTRDYRSIDWYNISLELIILCSPAIGSYMPSERIFRYYQELYAAVNKTGDHPHGPTGSDHPQQRLPPETFLASDFDPFITVLKYYSGSLLGLIYQQFVDGSEQQVPNFSKDSASVQEARRAFYEQTGYLPPIAGGAPNRIALPTQEIISLYRDEGISTSDLAQRFNVSVGTIYRILHEEEQASLVGTRIGRLAQQSMSEKSDQTYEKLDEQWYKTNEQELRKEKEQIREAIRTTLGEEFLKEYETTEIEIKELIRKREMDRKRSNKTP